MKKTSEGFVLFLIVVLIGVIAALYFLKDEKGMRYVDKLLNQKQEVIKEVDGYKEKMKSRDNEIKENL
ncbi:MAG: hypothetical protein RIQ72_129 [Candidatus Parcubacteria bacterium]|jgi:CHASE3 domain sensor protein